jgi:hypothetical protein
MVDACVACPKELTTKNFQAEGSKEFFTKLAKGATERRPKIAKISS